MNDEAEIWKDVVGYEGLYQVSSFGRVKALPKTKLFSDGRVYNYKEKILKYSTGTSGYPTLHLYSTESVRETCMIHRLVAELFIENPELKETVNHKDGNKENNRTSNLEWNTYQENNKHALDTGLTQVTASKLNSKLSKLSEEIVKDVLLNCKRKEKGFSIKDFSDKYGLTSTTISSIFKRFTLEEFECQNLTIVSNLRV